MKFREELNIDLASQNRQEIPIQIEWEIKVDEPTGIKKFFYKKYGKLEKEVRVAIENLKLDENLVTDSNLDQLVFLRSEGDCGNSLSFKLKDLKTFCRVIVDPNRIIDCKEKEKAYAERESYPLSFSVVLYDESSKAIESHDIRVDINLTPVHLNPSVRLVLEEDFTYSSDADLMDIGSIMISNPTPDLEFTPNIDVNLKLDINNSLDGKSIPADAIHIGKKTGKNTYEVTKLSPHDSRCKKIMDKEELVLPVYLDMRKLSNPLVPKETLQVVCNWSYRHSYNPAEYLAGERAIEAIDFKQDAQGAELILNLLDQEGNVRERIANGQAVTLPLIEFFAEGNTLIDRMFRFSNLATDTTRAGAGVKISGLTITESIDGAMMKDRNGNWVSELFDKSDSSVEELSSGSGVILRNGRNSYRDFTVTFDPAKVMIALQTKDFRFMSVLTVEFDYVENSFGKSFDSMTPQHFRFEIRQPLYLKPNPRWLCIDYGSSAIVCKYDDNLLKLRSRKTSIIKKALGKSNENLWEDTSEKNTEFLASDIVLHNPQNLNANEDVSALCSEQKKHEDKQYDKLGVFLSPTSSMIVNEVLRQLPCLKLLVGNEQLPPKKEYQTYSYDILNPNGGVEKVVSQNIKETNPEKSLVLIDNVFRESYEALLNYFVIPEVKNINLVNRLVLTYPNTYTPRHLDTIRSIVTKAIPAVRELEFVSESDAVAAYYLENWTQYHKNGADPNKDETILVFDMGAGTLDLSLIKKSVEPNGRLTMEILSKIGTCKAGNYLDYVLAEIVCDLIGEKNKGKMALASTLEAADANVAKNRTRLKEFVKNTLKPMLSGNRYENLEFDADPEGAKQKKGEQPKRFTVGQVLDDKRFIQFLNDVTEDIVGQLAKFSGENRPVVDTVLMSGRSSMLTPLREKLSNAVGKFNNKKSGLSSLFTFDDNSVSFIRLDEPVNGKEDSNRQKVAVTEGAMAIMSRNYRSDNSLRRIISKRIYASFGVAYQDLGSWHYVELLNYRHIPADIQGEYNGERINLPNLNNIPSLVVIQSYLDAESTEKALNEGKWDYLAEMERITLDGQSSEALMMKINSKSNVILYIGQQRTRGQSPKGDDLTDESIKRSVWPVTI